MIIKVEPIREREKGEHQQDDNENPGGVDIENLKKDVAKSESEHQDTRQWWDRAHETSHEFCSGTAGTDVWERLNITDRIIPGMAVLNIGVGLGFCTRELVKRGCVVDVLDMSQ